MVRSKASHGAVVAVALMLSSAAEQLPIRTYTTGEGLAGNLVARIVQDRRGFLWFCTSEGLSRFDGYHFVTFDPAQGLPDPGITDLLITRSGEYWVGTRKGLALFRPEASKSSRPRFTVYAPGPEPFQQHVISLAEDRGGGLWVGTYAGCYRMTGGDPTPRFEMLDLQTPAIYPRVITALVDRSGAVWVATKAGVFRRRPDGVLDQFTTLYGLPSDSVAALLEDRSGHLWAGTDDGLVRMPAGADPRRRLASGIFTSRDGLPVDHITALLESTDGTLWVGTAGGLCRMVHAGPQGAVRFSCYTTEHGLPHGAISALTEDREGNLWIGTDGGGAAKITRGGFTTYTRADGLRDGHITAIVETQGGEFCVTDTARPFISCLVGNRFISVRPLYPPGYTYFGWGWNQSLLQDHTGEWWMNSRAGVLRYPAVSRVEQLPRTPHKARYNVQSGLSGNDLFRIFEDSRGDVWMSTLSPGNRIWLAKWVRATGTVTRYPEISEIATAFREDRAGNLWIGFYGGGLARYRNGRFAKFGLADGLPEGLISDLFVDCTGKLWIACVRGGLAHIDDPGALHPRVDALTAKDGLSSSSIRCVTGDLSGRIYACTGKGVDRFVLTPSGAPAEMRHYTIADGLAPGELTVAHRDRKGDLWFGTARGLSRLTPGPERPFEPPVFISGVVVAGVAIAVSDIGEKHLRLPPLSAGQNQFEFEFLGSGFGSGERLRYEYRLVGTDRDWSKPAEARNVRYGGLPPGDYRFEVRALSARGGRSWEWADVSFRIEPPFWRRWTFIAPVSLLVLLAIRYVHRLRLGRAVALERVRTNIATDLHDDIGSGLTRIGILSELALRDSETDPSKVAALTRIAGLSRELGESTSDIVWSVNPARDRLSDLSQRMRRYAGELFAARDVGLEFHAPPVGVEAELDPEVRRQIYLVFKEALNNIVRHSSCTAASIGLDVSGDWLIVKMEDNGKGFEVRSETEGNGLRNMRRRAAQAGGTLDVASGANGPTTVTLTVPLGRRRAPWRRLLPKLAGPRSEGGA